MIVFTILGIGENKMKKLCLFLCVVVMFLGIVACPSENPTTTVGQSTLSSNSVTASDAVSGTIGNDVSPAPEPATLVLLGTGLVGLAGLGRKKFKK